MLQWTLHVLETGGSSLLTKFWQSLPSALQMPDCHIIASADAEAFLFWSPGRSPMAWSPSSGVPAPHMLTLRLAACPIHPSHHIFLH